MYDGLLIDVIIIGVLAVATATGLSRGILREVLSLVMWLIVVITAVMHFATLSTWLAALLPDPMLRGWIVVLLVVLATAMLLTILDVGLCKLHERAGRASHDPLLGLLFGAMRGMLVVTLVVILAHRTALPDRLAWHQSQFVGYAEALALSLRTHLPAEVAEQIQLRNSEQFGKAIVLPRDSRGHYVARAWLNGMPVEALVDTGATMVMVPAHLQHKLSLEAGRSFSVNTATGQAMAQQTIIDAIKIGPVLLHDVEAALVPSPKDTVLVGMSFLLKTRFQQTTDGLLLEQGRASFE
jgi:membrane protein required for colicin V production